MTESTSAKHPSAGKIAAALHAMDEQHSSATELLELSREQYLANESLNPLAYVDWEHARAQARALDEQRAHRQSVGAPMPPLMGIPLTVKDLFSVSGMPMAAGTRAPLPAFSGNESSLVTRLKQAGALIFAKTNMHEIALGATGENQWTGDVCNPFDPAHQAGGSSSGAGVCVATGIGLGGVGSDTGGSVRIPAAFCGVAGFKPSFGAIALDNALYLSWTCDHAGPLAPTVADCTRLYEVMSGRSAAHGHVPRAPRLGIPRNWLNGRLSAGMQAHFDEVLAFLTQQGVTFVDCPLPELPSAWVCYSPIVRAEAATVHKAALAGDATGFSPSVLAPMRAGEQISAVEYLEAMQMRERVRADLAATLKGIDGLLLPTTAVAPPRRGQEEVSVTGGTMSVREAVLGQTLPFSLCGLPALAVRSGFTDASQPSEAPAGLPLSMSLVGAFNADAAVLALGAWLEGQLGRLIADQAGS